MEVVFPNGYEETQLISKSRAAFLGLCEAGRIKGINKGHYSGRSKTKQATMKAITIVQESPEISSNPKHIRRIGPLFPGTSSFGPRDIIAGLIEHGLLILE